MSRRPSVSIYNYPEDLNPFNDDATTTAATTTTTTTTRTTTATSGTKQINPEVKNSVKEPKNKFWTFGRSKKKQRSNSFSIKSTWSGLFGKRKDSDQVEIRKPTIATVSSTYKRGTYNGYPVAPPRSSKDQQEFDEALGTLARRRKYTLDNSSRYSSTLTVNGDPGRIYEGSPQDTTTSIMGDLTPKAPARRFGQVSPKPTDKIPPLDYRGKERTTNGNFVHDERTPDRTPVPPKRGGPRSSTRSLAPVCPNDDVSSTSRSADVSIRDENENVPEDYVFKRFSQDAIRKSNLSINSCVSVGSTVSAYGRKKRRAPQPPRIKEPLESPKENDVRTSEIDEKNNELQIIEPIDIARVTENIDEMTKRSRELEDNFSPTCSARSNNNNNNDENVDVMTTDTNENQCISSSSEQTSNDVTRVTNEEKVSKHRKTSKDYETVKEEESGEDEEASSSAATGGLCTNASDSKTNVSETKQDIGDNDSENKNNDNVEIDVEVELRRKTDDRRMETTKDAECYASMEDFPLKRRKSSGNLSRSDSFSVKEEIEKIERQIKLLESINPRETGNDEDDPSLAYYEEQRAGTRMSLSETRKNFFRNMTDNDRVKVELRELPRQQNDIRIVRIEDSPIAIDGPTETVKIIELHISEPIKQKTAVIIENDVNPIPKPRRHSNFDLNDKETRIKVKHVKDDDEKRGNSL